jgi:hypothetical protein
MKWLKKRKNFSYECLIKLNFATINSPGGTKLLKSLYPIAELKVVCNEN